MSTLRELIVNIDFEGLDVKKLMKIDNAVDEIEDSFREMGAEVNQVTKKSAAMGEVADNALEEIQKEAFLASLAVDRLGDRFGMAALKAGALSVAILGVSSSLIAASAPILAATGALSSSFIAAGIGVVGFGAVTMGVFARLQKAVEEKNLSPIQADAVKDLKEFTHFWDHFVESFESHVFTSMENVLESVQTILTKMEPTLFKISNAVVEFTDKFNRSLQSDEAKEFFEWFDENAPRAFRNLVNTVSNFTVGIFEMFKAFTPLSIDTEKGFLNMSKSFKEWASNLENNQSFQNFISYAKENGPALIGTFKEIVDLGVNIVKELAPIGSTVLDGFKKLTGFINDNWGTVTTLIAGAGAAVGSFLVMLKGMQVVGIVTSLFKAWRVGTLLQTGAMLGLNMALLANPITWVVGGIALLIGAGVALYKNWDVVKEKAQQLWEKLQPVVDVFKGLKDKWDSFRDSFSGGVTNHGNMIDTGFTPVHGSHATGLENVPFNGYVGQLHKGEAVLPANQANTLRNAGILGKNGNRPNVNVGSGGGFNPNITINVNGNADEKEIAQRVRSEMERFWLQMNLKQA